MQKNSLRRMAAAQLPHEKLRAGAQTGHSPFGTTQVGLWVAITSIILVAPSFKPPPLYAGRARPKADLETLPRSPQLFLWFGRLTGRDHPLRNPYWYQYTGLLRAIRPYRFGWPILTHPDERALHVVETVETALKQGKDYEVEFRLRKKRRKPPLVSRGRNHHDATVKSTCAARHRGGTSKNGRRREEEVRAAVSGGKVAALASMSHELRITAQTQKSADMPNCWH